MDTFPITARSLARPYHIKGDDFERACKEFLSGYRTWKELAHADKWLVFPRNIGPRLSIDETSMSDGELYTIVSNKDAHGKKGALVAIVKGTRIEDVKNALERILWCLRAKVLEVTMDLSESMRAIVPGTFPYARITVDRFHVQRTVMRPCSSCASNIVAKNSVPLWKLESNTACATNVTRLDARRGRKIPADANLTAPIKSSSLSVCQTATPSVNYWLAPATF